MKVRMLQLVMLLAGWAHPASAFGPWILAMQTAGQVQGEGQPTPAGGARQQQRMGQRTRIRMPREPLSHCFLSDCRGEHLCHGSKIAGLRWRTASSADRSASPGRGR